MLMKATTFIVFVIFFTSCQSNTDVKKILAKQETRKEIMDSISSNSDMSVEMMTAMMSNHNSKMMMQGNEKMNMMMMEDHKSMMKMMKNNPAMMESMMTDMMETCKGDSSMMSGMCKTMMSDPKMMEMMNKMKGMDDKKTDHTAHH